MLYEKEEIEKALASSSTEGYSFLYHDRGRGLYTVRFIILILSLGTIFFYGKALGELGGYMVRHGSVRTIIVGLGAGSFCAAGALFLWFRDNQKK